MAYEYNSRKGSSSSRRIERGKMTIFGVEEGKWGGEREFSWGDLDRDVKKNRIDRGKHRKGSNNK